MTNSSISLKTKKFSAAIALSITCAITAGGAFYLPSTAAEQRASLMPRPDGLVELQAKSDGGTTMRIKTNTPPADAVNLEVFARDPKTDKFYNIGFCTTKEAVSSGADGCTFDAKAGGIKQEIRAYWFKEDGTKGEAWEFWGGDLSHHKPKGTEDKLLEGTITQWWVGSGKEDIIRVKDASVAAMKKHAAGCLQDAGVKAALKGMDKAANSAIKAKNPYVVGAGVVAKAIVKQDAKVYDNRCLAIRFMMQDVAAAAANAVKTGKSSRVYLTSVYGKWKGTPDSCVTFTSSGGWGGDSSDPTYLITRPQDAGGPNQGQCLHFWDPIVS